MKWIGRLASWLNGTKKSMGSFGFGLRMALSGGAPGGWASDHREETAHNTGFNYIAIHAIASQVASATVTVFADGDQTSQQQSRRKSLASRAGSFTRWKSIYGADDRETDPLPITHPLVRLLKRPNPHESGASFRYRQAQQIRLTGTCLVWNVPSLSGLTCERYVIPTAMATPVAPTIELPRGGWRINPVASRYTPIVDDGYVDCPSWYRILGQIVDARQVQLIRLPHAWYLDDGQSPLSAGAKWVDAGEAVDEARYHQLKNGIDPSIVWNLPPDVSPDQDEIDRTQAKISSKYGGPENVGRVLVAQSGTSITPLSTSPKEMCYTEGFQDLKSATLALHQTPPVAVGLQEPGAYAAYNASMKAWRHSAIQPLCELLAESDTEYLAPQFGIGLTVEIESDTVDDTDLIERQLQNDLAAKVRTKNEWRAVRGMPPLPGSQGDELVGSDGDSSKTNSASNELAAIQTGPNEDSNGVANAISKSLKDLPGLPEIWPNLRNDDLPNRARLIAEILHGLFGGPALQNSETVWTSEAKTFDPQKHPRDERGRFADAGVMTARNYISEILKGDGVVARPEKTLHHLSRLSTADLVKLHEEHGIVPVPKIRSHLYSSVMVRLFDYAMSETRQFLKPSRSQKITVRIQNEDKLVHRLPPLPSGDKRQPLTREQWAALVGARPGSTVHVFPMGFIGIAIFVEHPDYLARRIVRCSTIENYYMIVKPSSQGKGIAFEALSQQVDTATQQGFKYLEAGAMGHGTKISIQDPVWAMQGLKKPMGYYAWARMGFGGSITSLMAQRSKKSNSSELRAIAADFHQKFPGAKNVLELMATEEGQKWWLEYGGYFEGTFNLKKDSLSRTVLAEYAAKKRSAKSKSAIVQPQDQWIGHDDHFRETGNEVNDLRNPPEESWFGENDPHCENFDPLTAEDEAILDRIWEQIGRDIRAGKLKIDEIDNDDD